MSLSGHSPSQDAKCDAVDHFDRSRPISLNKGKSDGLHSGNLRYVHTMLTTSVGLQTQVESLSPGFRFFFRLFFATAITLAVCW